MKRLPGPVNESGITTLQRLMRYYQLSCRDLAGITGVSHGTISRITRGIDEPRVGVAMKLANIFQVSTEELWGNPQKKR